jgi:hypothetical protein
MANYNRKILVQLSSDLGTNKKNKSKKLSIQNDEKVTNELIESASNSSDQYLKNRNDRMTELNDKMLAMTKNYADTIILTQKNIVENKKNELVKCYNLMLHKNFTDVLEAEYPISLTLIAMENIITKDKTKSLTQYEQNIYNPFGLKSRMKLNGTVKKMIEAPKGCIL